MAEGRGVLFTSEAADRIITTIRAIEGVPPRQLARMGAARDTGLVARVTSGTPDGSGHYDAVITLYSAVEATWEDLGDVKLLALNGETLTNGTRYPVWPAGETAGGDELFLTIPPGGGGSATFSGVRVTRSTTLSLTTGTLTAVNWDTEDYDVGGFHSTVTNTNRLTAPASGYYQCTTAIGFDANATGARWVFILRSDGALIGTVYEAPAPAGYNTGLSCSGTKLFNAGQYAEVQVAQWSGGNLNMLSTNNFFEMVKVGDP